MNPSVCIQDSLPGDIALKIASSLQVFDVCGLGSCSRFWRELCGSDCLWESLCRDRWPTLALNNDSSALDTENCHLDQHLDSDLKVSSLYFSNCVPTKYTLPSVLSSRALCHILSNLYSFEKLPLSCGTFFSFLAIKILIGEKQHTPRPPTHQNSWEIEGWRGHYIKKHSEMAGKASFVLDYVNRRLSSDSIEVGYYLKAIEDLYTMQFGFKDVEMFFLKPNISVLFNLIGLHYCIRWLNVPVEDVIKALNKCKISEREVCVQWWKLGRWFHGFRLRDELHSRNVSLAGLATSKEGEILGVLQRGTMHEVLRVQISAVKSTSTSWCSQTSKSSYK